MLHRALWFFFLGQENNCFVNVLSRSLSLKSGMLGMSSNVLKKKTAQGKTMSQ